MWIALTAAFAADCVRQTTASELEADLVSARTALEAGEASGFQDAAARMTATAQCLGEAVEADAMAEYRMLLGVEAFGRSEADEAAGQFLAGRALSSDLKLPLYPEDHEIYGVFRRYDPVRTDRKRLKMPRRGTLVLDGFPTRDRYSTAPVLAQHVVDGEVVSSQMLAAGELPKYPTRHPVRNGLLASSGVLIGASAASLALNQSARSSFFKADNDYAQLNTLRSRANVYGGTTIALGTAAVSAGIAAILLRKH